MINFRVPLFQCRWRWAFDFTFSSAAIWDSCIMLGVEGISDGGERPLQC